MSATIINLIIQLIAGAAGGNILAKFKDFNLGPLGNTISGASAAASAVRSFRL